jgi:ubiquinone/menaquinone biosynthesis C-methylase UbiE
MSVGQRFARLVTQVVVRVPFLWRLFRRAMTQQFDRLAPEWDATRVSRERLAPMLAALDAVPVARRALDVGTGSGAVARLLSERWPAAEVHGVDVSPGMVEEARRLGGGERYALGDASSLPYDDGTFDLVTLNNMIPFFDELARVSAPGGHVAIAYSMGPRTPIWVPLERVRAELERRGFQHVADFRAGPGVALLARRP